MQFILMNTALELDHMTGGRVWKDDSYSVEPEQDVFYALFLLCRDLNTRTGSVLQVRISEISSATDV